MLEHGVKQKKWKEHNISCVPLLNQTPICFHLCEVKHYVLSVLEQIQTIIFTLWDFVSPHVTWHILYLWPSVRKEPGRFFRIYCSNCRSLVLFFMWKKDVTLARLNAVQKPKWFWTTSAKTLKAETADQSLKVNVRCVRIMRIKEQVLLKCVGFVQLFQWKNNVQICFVIFKDINIPLLIPVFFLEEEEPSLSITVADCHF